MIETYFNQKNSILGIYISNKCNLKCSHCSVNSGPRENRVINESELIQFLGEIKENTKIKGLHISGGEPFLFIKKLKSIDKIVGEKNLLFAINSNGFFGKSQGICVSFLEALPNLTQIFFSTDIYHKGVDIVHLKRAIVESLARGIVCHIGICTEAGRTNKFVDSIKLFLGSRICRKVKFSIVPVEAEGRGSSLREANWRSLEKKLPEGKCKLLKRPVILDNGVIWGCCNTTVYNSEIHSPIELGNIKSTTPMEMIEISKNDQILNALESYGPGQIAKFLKSKSMGGNVKESYLKGKICHLCQDIMTSKEDVLFLREHADELNNSY